MFAGARCANGDAPAARDHAPASGEARPRLRGLGHGLAGALAPVAAVALFGRAPGGAAKVAVAGYGVTLVAMLVASAAYHRGRWGPVARRRMKALDHTTIFAFIVGSYAPLAVVALGVVARVVFLGSVGAVALTGVVLKLRELDRPGGPADLVYGLTTCWGALVGIAIVHVLALPDLALLLAGLGCFAASAGALAGRRPDPVPQTFGYHEVAHTLVLLGVACHYLLYWRLMQ